MTGTIHPVGQAERNGRLKERLADCVADFNESDDPLERAELITRIRALRAEITAAEAKIPRMRAAIATRKQTLSRLEARLAMSNARPVRVPHA